MDDHDQAVRAELAADGSLFDGYHPRMAAVHDANAARLQAIILEVGWPTERLVGTDGAKAAHRIAQHAINHPLEDSAGVDERRTELGLPSLAELRASGPAKTAWDLEAAQKYDNEELAWRRAVGWLP